MTDLQTITTAFDKARVLYVVREDDDGECTIFLPRRTNEEDRFWQSPMIDLDVPGAFSMNFSVDGKLLAYGS